MPDRPHRRLTRSTDRRVGGVCSGIADYFAVDPTLVRVGFVLLAIFSMGMGSMGIGAWLAYGLLWAIMPESEGDASPRRPEDFGNRVLLVGGALAIFGAVLLFQRMQWFWWMHWGLGGMSWPLLLLVGGVLVILVSRRR